MFHFGTNHRANGGTASCRSAVFFGSEEEEGRRIGGGQMTLRGWKRNRGGRERDFGGVERESERNGTGL